MRLFGGHMGGCGGRNESTDCCERIFLLWILSACGCGCGFNFDCDTIIILLLLLCCGGCGGHDDCR